MEDFLAVLYRYLYGMGWLVLCLVFTGVGFKVLDRLVPIDFKAEIEKGNMAFGIMMGLFLFGLTFGTLYFAGSVS